MKRVRNKGLIVFSGMLILPALLVAQSVDTTGPKKYSFTVKQAVNYAIKNNLNVKNALVDVQVQGEGNREITSNAMPRITGNLGKT